MGFSLFRRESSVAADRERRDRLERRLAQGLQQLSLLFRQAADLLEARRQERNGYGAPEKFLERAERRRP